MEFTPKDWYPAICLAVNHAAKGIEIYNWQYIEELDVWHIECSEHGEYYREVELEGSFIRCCYTAAQHGKKWPCVDGI